LNPEEGGSKYPIASYFKENIHSMTWNTITNVIIGDPKKNFIMPGEVIFI
jgi:hypothetical protein